MSTRGTTMDEACEWSCGALVALAMAGCGGSTTAPCPTSDAHVEPIDAPAVEVPGDTFVDREEIDFSVVCLGRVGAPTVITIVNAGTGPVEVASRLVGPEAADFVIVETTCASPIAARSVCTVAVAPSLRSETPEVSATLEVDAGDDRWAVALRASAGICDGPTVDPSPWSFDDATVGERSAPMTFHYRNSGEGLSDPVTRVELGGLDASQFEIVRDGCSGHALVPSAQCEVEVLYAPMSVGLHMGTLQITGFGTATVALQGRALAP